MGIQVGSVIGSILVTEVGEVVGMMVGSIVVAGVGVGDRGARAVHLPSPTPHCTSHARTVNTRSSQLKHTSHMRTSMKARQ